MQELHPTRLGFEAHADGFEDRIFDDLETGSYTVYWIYCIVAVFFDIVGFFMAFGLATSHAARMGSISGLGITIALYSASIMDLANAPGYWKDHKEFLPSISFVVAFSGYVCFLYGLFTFQKIRREAENGSLATR